MKDEIFRLMTFCATDIGEDDVRRWDDKMQELRLVMDRVSPGDMLSGTVMASVLDAVSAWRVGNVSNEPGEWSLLVGPREDAFWNKDYWDRYGTQCQRVFELKTGTEIEKVIKDAVTRAIIGFVCEYEMEKRYDKVDALEPDCTEYDGVIRLLSHNSHLRQLIGDYCDERKNADYWPAVNADWPALDRERLDQVEWDRLSFNWRKELQDC